MPNLAATSKKSPLNFVCMKNVCVRAHSPKIALKHLLLRKRHWTKWQRAFHETDIQMLSFIKWFLSLSNEKEKRWKLRSIFLVVEQIQTCYTLKRYRRKSCMNLLGWEAPVWYRCAHNFFTYSFYSFDVPFYFFAR